MKLYELLFPPRCTACGTLLRTDSDDVSLCEHCRSKWELAKRRAYRELYGQPVRDFSGSPDERFGRAMFCLFYEPRHFDNVESRVIFRLKDRADRRVTSFVASELCAIIRENAPFLLDDDMCGEAIITWIPRRISSIKKYGFDHMCRVAKRMGEKLSLPCKKLLRRRYFTAEQKKLGTNARRLNASASMTLASGACVSGKTVILIDDIITSGASLNAAAELLIEAGAAQVITAVLAATNRESEEYLLENGFNIIKKPKSKQ